MSASPGGSEYRLRSQPRPLVQYRRLDGLRLQVKELFALVILHKVVEILFPIKFHEVDLVGFVDVMLNERIVVRPYSQQQPAIVFRDYGDGDVFELVEDVFLSRDDVDELGYVDHAFLETMFMPI